MSEKNLWSKLAQNYVKAGRFPFPVSDTIIEILKEILTEDQAKFLLLFKKPSYNIEEINAKTDLNEISLQKMLGDLANIGALTVIPSRSTGAMIYRLPPFFPGLLEFTLMKGGKSEKDKKLAKLWQKFFNEMVRGCSKITSR